MIDQFMKMFNLKFKNPQILKLAFTHRSYLNENKGAKESNERMEFLGDAVLSFIISSYLYSLHPNYTEGDLTNLRSYIVKTESLAQASRELELGKYLLMSKGEELSGGRENTQLLANTFEALLGAIYLDQGIEEAKLMVKKFLLPNFEHELKIGPPKDAKSRLQEVVQQSSKRSPHYKILGTKGPDHLRTFRVGVFINGREFGQGEGNSKQDAEEIAANKALRKLTPPKD